MFAQIIISNTCPDWLPYWYCTLFYGSAIWIGISLLFGTFWGVLGFMWNRRQS